MEGAAGTGERQEYESAVADLWERLGTALARLERIAESPSEEVAGEAEDELRTLQYSLHAGAELALGIPPPAEAATVHAELIEALTQAREATAEVAGALETGDHELVERLLPEWRGTLFRVRLARLRALERSPLELPEVERPTARKPTAKRGPGVPTTAVVATALVVTGALLFTAGAVLAAWPLWAAGLALFAGSFLLFRP